MHQLGHSRAQIMHEVQAGSISRIEPWSRAAPRLIGVSADGTPATDRGLGHLARVRSRPRPGRGRPTPRSGTPGGTIRRRLGDRRRRPPPAPCAPGQAQRRTRRQDLVLAQRRTFELRPEQQPPAVAADELHPEQLGGLPLVPGRAGEEVPDAVQPRGRRGDRHASSSAAPGSSRSAQRQHDPERVAAPISSTQPSQSKQRRPVRPRRARRRPAIRRRATTPHAGAPARSSRVEAPLRRASGVRRAPGT